MAKIGFIGLGTMGLPMSINLINGDHKVTGFDKNSDKLSAFQRAGGVVAKSSLECIKQAEFIITMLPQSSDVSEILINKNGNIVETYASFTKPTSKKIVNTIEELIN